MTHPILPDAASIDFVLSWLPEAVLLAMIREKAVNCDLPWLERMLNQGFFDVQGLAECCDQPSLTLAVNAWSERCGALMEIMGQGEVNYHPENFASFSRTPPVLAFYQSALMKMAQQAAEMSRHPNASKDHQCAANSVMSLGMGTACVLDLPQTLDHLCNAFPLALQDHFPLSNLGLDFENTRFNSTTPVLVKPLFCALTFSRTQCLDVLLQKMEAKECNLGAWENESGDQFDLTLMQSLSKLTNMCTPQAFGKVLVKVLSGQDETTLRDVFKTGIEMLLQLDLRYARYTNESLIPAFFSAKVFHCKPVEAIEKSLAAGKASLLNCFEANMPWDDLKSQKTIFSKAVFSGMEAKKNEAILRLFDLAARDGCSDIVLNLFINEKPRCFQNKMLKLFLDDPETFPVLVKLLHAGLDPCMEVQSSAQNMIQCLQNGNSDAATIVHSYLARKAATQTLDDMERESKITPKTAFFLT